MSELASEGLEYLLARSCGPRWHGFLQALAGELQEQLPVGELRGFFHAVGRRMARAVPLQADTLDALELAINAHLGPSGWGLLSIRDLDEAIELVHCCAPLRAAFGADALTWSSALLEGLYAEWLSSVGAGDELVLQQFGAVEGGADVVRFRLAHAAAAR